MSNENYVSQSLVENMFGQKYNINIFLKFIL